MKRIAWPWAFLVLAAIAAFLSDSSGPEVGFRVMLLLIAAAIIAAIQDLADRSETRRFRRRGAGR